MKKIPMLERFAAQSLVESEGELIFSKEKFAELIIKECAKVADESLNIITMKPEWPSKYIKEHFGVE
jgi:hypothetical protein